MLPNKIIFFKKDIRIGTFSLVAHQLIPSWPGDDGSFIQQ